MVFLELSLDFALSIGNRLVEVVARARSGQCLLRHLYDEISPVSLFVFVYDDSAIDNSITVSFVFSFVSIMLSSKRFNTWPY